MRGAGGLEGGDGGGGGGGGGGPPSGPAGGIDISGTYPNALTVIGLRGRSITATVPVLGDVLAFDGTNWAPVAPATGLPSQVGNANKVLTTNGTTASWTATLVDVALTGVDAALTIQSALDLNISSTGGLIDIQSALDVNITALGGLVGQFGDNISLNTSNGTAELGGTGTTSLASVSANVSISANNGIALNTTTGIVSVPLRVATDDGDAAASTAHVKDYLPTPGADGTVHRSNGSAWVTTTLAAADVTATTAGLAGSTVQANLTDAASRLYTRVEVNVPFALGSAPTYIPILTIPIAAGTRILLDGYIHLSGGTQAAPTSGAITFGGVSTIIARRPTTGAPTVSGTPAVVGGTIPALAAQAVISGNDLVIQARATGGPSVTAVFYYRVEVLSTPA